MKIANYLPLCALATTIGALPINQGTTGPKLDISSQPVTKDNMTLQIGSIKAGNAERIGFGIGEVATGRDSNELVDLIMGWPESDPGYKSVGAALTRTKPINGGDASRLEHLVFKDKDAFKTVNFKRGLGDGLALDIEGGPARVRNTTVLGGFITAKPIVNGEPSQGESDRFRFSIGGDVPNEEGTSSYLGTGIGVQSEKNPATDSGSISFWRKKPVNKDDATPIEYAVLRAGTTKVQMKLPLPISTKANVERDIGDGLKLDIAAAPGPLRNTTVLNGLITAEPIVNGEPPQGDSDGLRFTV